MALFFQHIDVERWTRKREVASVTTRVQLDELRAKLGNPTTTWREKNELMKSIGQGQLFLLKESDNEKVRSILKWRETFESIHSIDLLSLRRQWIPLFEYLFVKKGWDLNPIKLADLKQNEEFTVNFWVNKYMKESVGAGDILPAEISEIEINGKKGQRKNIWGRPWYYALEWKDWVYRPIYDGDTVKILSVWSLDDGQIKRNKETEDAFFKQRAMEDILESIRLGKDPRKELEYLTDDEYSESYQYAQQIQEERADRLSRMPKPKSEKEFLSNFGEYLDSVCKKFNVPQEVMMAIFRKETNNFSSSAVNKSSWAHWIGQIIPTTWTEIQDKTLPKYGVNGKMIDRNNIQDQILAATCYLRDRADLRGGKIEDGIMWYFWVSWENIETVKASNHVIYDVMKEKGLTEDPRWLETAYIFWLWLTPRNIPEIYNDWWKNQLPKEEPELADASGLPLWENEKITKDGTMCGYTARENGSRFGAIFPPVYDSSHALSRYIWENSVRTDNPITALSHAKEAEANIIDIVFENTKWSDKWHRACGIIAKNGSCYVYDPYYQLWRTNVRTAIPYEQYMDAMLNVQKKILVWVWFHSSSHQALKQYS